MKTKDEGLQKLTNENINRVLNLNQITPDDLDKLNKSEQDKVMEILTERLNNTKGIERDNYWEKIQPFIQGETRNQYWENNHNKMIQEITAFIKDYGRMPSKTELAESTGLSRQTIHKHLKEYASHPQYLGQIEQFKFITSKVLAKVFQFAINGDMSAAKLYFNAMGCLGNKQTPNNTLINTQNNFIQINGKVISQETLKNLSPEQLNEFEVIFNNILPDATKTINSSK
jgi:hypothetical protein